MRWNRKDQAVLALRSSRSSAFEVRAISGVDTEQARLGALRRGAVAPVNWPEVPPRPCLSARSGCSRISSR
jgi:hypothetical protein